MPFNLEDADEQPPMNSHLMSQGAKGKANLSYIDPDQDLGVMDPGYDKWKTTQDRLETVGTAADLALAAAPFAGPVLKGAKFVAGELANEVLAPRVGRKAVEGAVKLPGGMWHPEAVDRLAKPLADKLANGGSEIIEGITPPDIVAKVKPTNDWSQRAVKNYLNKHAGTERDPLKDVEIPFGEGTKRWEDVTDKAIDKRPAGDYKTKYMKSLPNQESIPDGEAIHEVKGAGSQDGMALRSYLSHVGDFLRQNVDPAKLPQYDLVRAVKETSANDARVVKEMEKASSTSTAQLPIHKEYPDGFKWVEIKAPEKLSEEQAKGVKHVRDVVGTGVDGTLDFNGTHIAVDKEGNPIKNHYTEEAASGNSPEEAWLSGRLAEEGNSLGHCVGGYCDDVSGGKSKIYSLRDPKGKSHVTVEVQPVNPPLSPAEWFDEVAPQKVRDRLHSEDGTALGQGTTQKWLSTIRNSPEYQRYHSDLAEYGPEKISQIKGKQNAAPKSDYLPYVQDFVKGGSWSDVGDLENTGLVKHPQTGGYVTQEELAAQGGKERGSASPALLAAAAPVAAGAMLGVPKRFQREGAAPTPPQTTSAAPQLPARFQHRPEDTQQPPPEDHSYDTDKDYAPSMKDKIIGGALMVPKIQSAAGKIIGGLVTDKAAPHMPPEAAGALGTAAEMLTEAPPIGAAGELMGGAAGLAMKGIGRGAASVAGKLTGASVRAATKEAINSMREDLLRSADEAAPKAVPQSNLAEAATPAERPKGQPFNTLWDEMGSWPKSKATPKPEVPKVEVPKPAEMAVPDKSAISKEIERNIYRGDVAAKGSSAASQARALSIYKNTIEKALKAEMLTPEQYESAMANIDKISSLKEKTSTARKIALSAGALAGISYGSRHIVSEALK